MRLAITGATGVVGRHLLFEFIKQHLGRLDELEVLVLGRADADAGASLRERMERVVLEDGAPYVLGEGRGPGALTDYCRERIRCVDMDLEREDLALSVADLRLLRSEPIDCLLHCAALTDLRNTPAVAAAARGTNLLGTRRLLALVDSLRVGEFGYVGSAYCCGRAAGAVPPDYANGHDEFRNPYERTKLEGELAVRRHARRSGLRCRYFRPSVVCGRMIEPPLGAISKFGVIYSVGAFGARLRQRRRVAPPEGTFRACCNPRSGLNVVPADYVAKAIYQVIAQDDPGESYHVVNERSIPNPLLVHTLLEGIGVADYELVERLPARLTRLEALFYRSAVGALLPYVCAEEMTFDTRSISTVLDRACLNCPPIDGDALRMLIGYAQERNFGLAGPAGQAPARVTRSVA